MSLIQEIKTANAMESMTGSVPLNPAERRRESGERGSTLFEFAMVAVLTLVLMFGMIDLARALYSYHFVTTAAREAARYASVRGVLCSSSVTSCPTSDTDVSAFVTAITPQGIDSSQVTTVAAGINNLPVCSSAPSFPLPPYYPGCTFTITVKYNFNWIFPVSFYNLAPVNFQAGTIAMSSTSEIVQSR